MVAGLLISGILEVVFGGCLVPVLQGACIEMSVLVDLGNPLFLLGPADLLLQRTDGLIGLRDLVY
jgi:hypothetical protein